MNINANTVVTRTVVDDASSNNTDPGNVDANPTTGITGTLDGVDIDPNNIIDTTRETFGDGPHYEVVTTHTHEIPEPEPPANQDPLVFDLGETGIQTTSGRVDFDIDGDGDLDSINDVLGDGILSFDADGDGVSGEDGSELFGNNTDFGGQQFANGFEALRAMAESEGLVAGADQTLSSADLAVLEDKYGLGIKLDGYNGETTSLADAGITEIQLGRGRIDMVENFDGRGNDLESQQGASFTLESGEERDYYDLWHRIAE